MIWGNQLKNALCLRRKNDLNLLNTKPASQCNEHAPVDPASLITLGQMVSQPTLPKSLLKTFKCLSYTCQPWLSLFLPLISEKKCIIVILLPWLNN